MIEARCVGFRSVPGVTARRVPPGGGRRVGVPAGRDGCPGLRAKGNDRIAPATPTRAGRSSFGEQGHRMGATVVAPRGRGGCDIHPNRERLRGCGALLCFGPFRLPLSPALRRTRARHATVPCGPGASPRSARPLGPRLHLFVPFCRRFPHRFAPSGGGGRRRWVLPRILADGSPWRWLWAPMADSRLPRPARRRLLVRAPRWPSDRGG